MLHLKTAAGERLEIPAACIIAVMQPCDRVNPSAIIYDIGVGPQIDQLGDQYGFVKKSFVDSSGVVNPIEVRILEPIAPAEGGQPVQAEGRLFMARSRIIGRREIRDNAEGIRAHLFVNLLGKPSALNIADTLDELDGIEPDQTAAAPVPTTEGN